MTDNVVQELALHVFNELCSLENGERVGRIAELIGLIEPHWNRELLYSYRKQARYRQFFANEVTVYHPCVVGVSAIKTKG